MLNYFPTTLDEHIQINSYLGKISGLFSKTIGDERGHGYII